MVSKTFFLLILLIFIIHQYAILPLCVLLIVYLHTNSNIICNLTVFCGGFILLERINTYYIVLNGKKHFEIRLFCHMMMVTERIKIVSQGSTVCRIEVKCLVVRIS